VLVLLLPSQALEDLSMQYDATVRNSEGAVVQFVYGDDGLSPQCMETTTKIKLPRIPDPVDVGRPVEFGKLMTHVKATEPCDDERDLEPVRIHAVGCFVSVVCVIPP
jgi:DNA-directed RNA polymerase III subunit RPC1